MRLTLTLNPTLSLHIRCTWRRCSLTIDPPIGIISEHGTRLHIAHTNSLTESSGSGKGSYLTTTLILRRMQQIQTSPIGRRTQNGLVVLKVYTNLTLIQNSKFQLTLTLIARTTMLQCNHCFPNPNW